MNKKSSPIFIIILSALTVSVLLSLHLRKAADAHDRQYGRVDVIGPDSNPGESLRKNPDYSEERKTMKFWQDAYRPAPNSLVNGEPLTRTLLAKAEPDECFYGIGISGSPDIPPCGDGGLPKVNQGFAWGMARSGDNIWFGTGANVQCLAKGAYANLTHPYQNSCYVCEFGQSACSPPLPAALGDWRPPCIFVYNLSQKTLTEKTPHLPLIEVTLGIRSAGTLNEVVFLGGPSLTGGINLFAFNTTTGEFLGSKNFPEYNNIRKWLAVHGILYTTVGNSQTYGGGGSVLRWTGDPEDPFQFEVVGILDGTGAELAFHERRIFVSTWPSIPESDTAWPELAGLWMSPPVPRRGGLTKAHKGLWKKAWQVDAYEPDTLTASTYGGGALASFGGYLYWGTMHVPLISAFIHFKTYGLPANLKEALDAIFGTYRAISIFRGKNFGTEREKIRLVYGMSHLPRFTPDLGWEIVPNNLPEPRPLWGLSGFGNMFNLYTWAMSVYHDRLYVGTLDWGLLFRESLNTFLKRLHLPPLPSDTLKLPVYSFGADLFFFPSPLCPAVPESIDGAGNYTNYGIRTMISDDEALYLGTANPMNLLTDPNDEVPEGGWELIKLAP
jgi:hypothetical protein